MVRLAGAVTMAVADAFGPDVMLRRLADPWWFQAFGCVLGFDWHSSGLTTVTCGAIKEAQSIYGDEMGILAAGGKGGTSRNTPREITATADRLGITAGDRLVDASRMSAKVDSAALQDGFPVYQHNFFFTPSGTWCVVQQGMHEASGWARRYHWLGEHVADFVCEPHEAVRGPGRAEPLNMVAEEAAGSRQASAELVQERPDAVVSELKRMQEGPTLFAPARHPLLPTDVNLERLEKTVRSAHEAHPEDFRNLLGTAGVGPATVRSLALVAELIYDTPPSRRDPASIQAERPVASHASSGRSAPWRRWADYAYAHGGKDGTPFPVDRTTYDRTVDVLTDAVKKARVGRTEKREALRRLATLDREVDRATS